MMGLMVCVVRFVCLFVFFLLFGGAIATNNMRLQMVGDGGFFWKVEKGHYKISRLRIHNSVLRDDVCDCMILGHKS